MDSRIAIVTGASSGIGAATAVRLATEFTGVVLVARRIEELEKIADKVRQEGAQPFVVPANLIDPAAAGQVIEQTIGQFGRIDALVNVAGAVPQINLFEMADEQWQNGLEVKFHSARRLAIHAWPHLKKTRGSVIWMSGTSAEAPKPTTAAMAAINAAIDALAKAFAEQGILDGIQVNAVLPGPIMTDRRKTFIEQFASARGFNPRESEQKMLEEARIERFGLPSEVAELIAFLLSQKAKFITGTAIRIDGGEVKGI